MAQLRGICEPTVWLKATCPVILTRAVGQLQMATRGHVVGFVTRPMSAPGVEAQGAVVVVCQMGGERVEITRQRVSVHETGGNVLLFT